MRDRPAIRKSLSRLAAEAMLAALTSCQEIIQNVERPSLAKAEETLKKINAAQTWGQRALKELSFFELMEKAAEHLPEGSQVHITVERGSAWCDAEDKDGKRIDFEQNTDQGLKEEFSQAIAAACKLG